MHERGPAGDATPVTSKRPSVGSNKMQGAAAGAALPLYAMLGLTTALFAAQLALSHVTHALTLLVDSYHMLCNLIALTGCIITIKKGLGGGSPPVRSDRGHSAGPDDGATEHSTLRDGARHSAADRRLRNTFGWARIDVLVSLIGTVFLASLCFSLVVEAVLTLLHIGHHDEMHMPLYVAGAGVASLAVNVLCYVLLGGYTFHQGSFFHVTENGDVVLEPAVTQASVKMGERRLSSQRRLPPRTPHQVRQRQGCREMLRDTVGCVLVIITSLIVYFTDKSVAKYADPIMSIVSAVLLLILSYPYMKEAGLILLQTIPEHMDIDELRTDFEKAFPGIVNIHDLHVWRLNQSKVFCTAHVRFRNAQDFQRASQDVASFFAMYGVTQVTVQPEFHTDGSGDAGKGPLCLMRCPGGSCVPAHCCESSAHGANGANGQHYLRIASDLSLPDPGPAAHACRAASACRTTPGSVAAPASPAAPAGSASRPASPSAAPAADAASAETHVAVRSAEPTTAASAPTAENEEKASPAEEPRRRAAPQAAAEVEVEAEVEVLAEADPSDDASQD